MLAMKKMQTYTQMMKLLRNFYQIILLATIASADELPEDLQHLMEKRTEAVAKIDAAFISKLEKLKIKYTKVGDLDTANAIVALIEKFKATDPNYGNLPIFPNNIFGEIFSWSSNGTNHGNKLILLEGGKGSFSGDAITWRKMNGRKLRLNFKYGNPEIEFSDDSKSFEGIDADKQSKISGYLIK